MSGEPAHIKVTCDGLLGHLARVYYVSKDGTETDISDVCQGVRFGVDIGVGNVNTATLDVIKVKPDVRVMVKEIDRALSAHQRLAR